MSNFIFPSDTCVLACSGPSLNLVDPFSLGVPVVAVSTAIRVIHRPHFWILADYLNEMHGEYGNTAYQNENITKVIPTGKISLKNKNNSRNFIEIDYADTDNRFPDRLSHVFSGNLPLLRASHKSVTFAIQWLHYAGVKRVIWVGNDLSASSPEKKYAYESTDVDLRKAYNYNLTLDQVHKNLIDWYPIAIRRGFEWYSWKCGDIFEKFVPKFEETSYEYPENSDFYKSANLSAHSTVSASFGVYREPKLTRKKRKENVKNKIENNLKQKEIKVDEKPVPVKIIPRVDPPKQIKSVRIPPTAKTKFTSVRKGIPSKLNGRIRDAFR